MLLTRVIPCLLLQGSQLVKTTKFKDPTYVGDPVNAVKIYNEKEVDELIFLDITATKEQRSPPFSIIRNIADECFMPLTYGGGIRSLDDIKHLFDIGIEKVALNSYAAENPEFITEASGIHGRQSIVVSIDVKKSIFGNYRVFTHSGTQPTRLDPVRFAKNVETLGAGELLLTSIDRDGAMTGYDIDLIQQVSSAVNIPVIACGGAGRISDFADAVHQGGASAVAAGSMVVFQGKARGVLINFPERADLLRVLAEGDGNT